MSTKRGHKLGSGVTLAAVVVLSNACQPKAWEQTARHGNLQELSKSIDTQRRGSGFSTRDLERLAYTVAERELLTARDPHGNGEAEDPAVEALSTCTSVLGSILEHRAKRDDDTASAATLSLVEAGKPIGSVKWLELSRSPFGWARAAAARASGTASRFAYRTQALSDPDSRVRHAALASCIDAPAREHWDALFTLLRAAPDPKSRTLAAHAIGQLGGDDAFRVLTDIWPRASVELRLSIVNALAQRATFEAGGKDNLVAIARSEPGIVGVAAAVSLATGHSSATEIGHSRITRALTSGSVEEQRLALVAATWSRPEQAEQLVRLGLPTSDPVVRAAALGRWLERPDHVWAATTLLREMSEPPTPQALLARHLLAQRKDWSVAKALSEQQRYANAEARTIAAEDLLALGDYNAVARTLADDSPAVRLHTACLVLTTR